MLKKNKNLTLLLNSFKKYKSQVLIRDIVANRKITYQDFFDKVVSFIAYLKKKKLNLNDRIIIKIDNSAEYLVSVLACLLGGFTACPIDSQIPKIKYQRLKKILNPKIVINKKNLIKYAKTKDIKFNDKNFVSIILFTSGTTGNPKGIQISASSYIGIAESFGRLAEYGDQTKIYHCLPMHYNAGLLNTFLAGLIHGSSIVLGPKINSINILNLCNSLINQNIDMLHLTPEIANGLTKINSNSLEKETVNEIHKIICTGSYLYGATKEDFEKKFQKRLYSCYGLTEIGGPITLQNWEDTFEENSVGIVLDEVKIKIIKKNGLNHINVKSPYLFEGYILENGKIEKPKLSQGYFDTGDIGFVNKNHLYITGRRKDISKKGSEIISSKDLENVCHKHKFVKDCCVLIKEDLTKGSKIYFFIVFKNISKLNKNINELYKYLTKKLKKIELPDKIIPVPKILKTSNGKSNQFEMEKMYL